MAFGDVRAAEWHYAEIERITTTTQAHAKGAAIWRANGLYRMARLKSNLGQGDVARRLWLQAFDLIPAVAPRERFDVRLLQASIQLELASKQLLERLAVEYPAHSIVLDLARRQIGSRPVNAQ